MQLRRALPRGPVRRLLRRARATLKSPPALMMKLLPRSVVARIKGRRELQFWTKWTRDHGIGPETEYYRRFMLAMGGISDESVFVGKVCLDIGCGPMGSLTWLRNHAKAAIGLDPLANDYRSFGIGQHDMIYLNASAESIPLPDEYVDVLFCMNALDHVENVRAACFEIRRILKPGGWFIGSINLDEPPSWTEPWCLTESFLDLHLFRGWEREFWKVCPRLQSNEHFGPYKYMFEECPPAVLGARGPRALWCRFRKR